MALAGRPTRGHAVDAGSDQPLDLCTDLFELDLTIFPERRGHRRYDASQSALHAFFLFVSIPHRSGLTLFGEGRGRRVRLPGDASTV